MSHYHARYKSEEISPRTVSQWVTRVGIELLEQLSITRWIVLFCLQYCYSFFVSSTLRGYHSKTPSCMMTSWLVVMTSCKKAWLGFDEAKCMGVSCWFRQADHCLNPGWAPTPTVISSHHSSPRVTKIFPKTSLGSIFVGHKFKMFSLLKISFVKRTS